MISHGAMDIWIETKTSTFLVNKQRTKHYFSKDVEFEEEMSWIMNEA